MAVVKLPLTMQVKSPQTRVRCWTALIHNSHQIIAQNATLKVAKLDLLYVCELWKHNALHLEVYILFCTYLFLDENTWKQKNSSYYLITAESAFALYIKFSRQMAYVKIHFCKTCCQKLRTCIPSSYPIPPSYPMLLYCIVGLYVTVLYRNLIHLKTQKKLKKLYILPKLK